MYLTEKIATFLLFYAISRSIYLNWGRTKPFTIIVQAKTVLRGLWAFLGLAFIRLFRMYNISKNPDYYRYAEIYSILFFLIVVVGVSFILIKYFGDDNGGS
jgi:hypothetical protein